MLSHTCAGREFVRRTASLLSQSLRCRSRSRRSLSRRYGGGDPLRHPARKRAPALAWSERRVQLGIVAFHEGTLRASTRCVVAAAQNRQRAPEWISMGRRRGVSSEAAAAASAAARRRGAASRKATLQARAPEEDTPRRPSEMVHKKVCTTMPARLDRRVQCDRFNPICCADTECLRVVGQTLANERS